jgi:predicted RNA-binding protein YlxR (DUF448 family)
VGADTRGHLRLDASQRGGGRGAYVCPRAACIEDACRRSAWSRALRRGVARQDAGQLVARLVEALREELSRLLVAGLADGRVVEGTVVEAGLRRRIEALAVQLEQLAGEQLGVPGGWSGNTGEPKRG